MHLTAAQIEENDNMTAVRESIEWSYARAEQLWRALLIKDRFKIDKESDRVFAEIRVMYFLTNCKVCTSEGSTMTGHRMFRCPPPTLQEYLDHMDNY